VRANDRIVRQFLFKDADTGEAAPELDIIRLYFVEMGKFHKDWREIRTALDRWLAFLNRAKDLDADTLPQELRAEPAIIKAAAQLDRIGHNPAERAIYEGEEKAIMVGRIEIESAKVIAAEQAHQKGLQEGLQQGHRDMVLLLLTSRLGEVPASLTDRLSAMSRSGLRELSLALFDFDSYKSVEAWLDERSAT
jgi:hypothetical protein